MLLKTALDLSIHAGEVTKSVREHVFDGAELDDNVLNAQLTRVITDIALIIQSTCPAPSEEDAG